MKALDMWFRMSLVFTCLFGFMLAFTKPLLVIAVGTIVLAGFKMLEKWNDSK